MTVFEVLERVPGALEMFREHGIYPTAECGPLTRQIRLVETPDRCHVEDLAELIDKLNTALPETAEVSR